MTGGAEFAWTGRPVLVTGATGLIGSALVERLRAHGHTVRRFVHSPRDAREDDVVWDAERNELPAGALDGVLDAVAGHRRAMGVVETAAPGLGQARTGVRNDDGFTHAARSPWMVKQSFEFPDGRTRIGRPAPQRQIT